MTEQDRLVDTYHTWYNAYQYVRKYSVRLDIRQTSNGTLVIMFPNETVHETASSVQSVSA